MVVDVHERDGVCGGDERGVEALGRLNTKAVRSVDAVFDAEVWMMRIPYSQMMGDTPDDEIIIPGPKKRDPKSEWRLQASCVKLCKQYERLNKDFWWMAPGAFSITTDPRKASFAKMIGYRKGVLDVWLVRRLQPGYKIETVELKREDGRLTPEQRVFFEWAPWPCHRVDSLGDFATVLTRFLA